MLTPPTTTAATTCSSSPWPAVTVMLPKRDQEHEPGQAGERAADANAQNTSRCTGRPAVRAASGFEPIA